MKKVFLMMLLTVVAVGAAGQNPRSYEKKEVISIDSVSAGTLYVRALETLSDWAGSQQRSKANVDVQDKDEGLIIYKGKIYLGYGKVNFMYGWDTYADFTLKLRCKDGRVQIAMTVPSMTFHWTAENEEDLTIGLDELYPDYNYKGKYRIKKATASYAPTIAENVDLIVKLIGERIATGVDYDF